MVLTGRPVPAEEALRIGLVERVVEPGQALAVARTLAGEIASFPQAALRGDRRSLLRQWSLSLEEAMRAEHEAGMDAIANGEAQAGAKRFAEGGGRHGA